MRASSAVRPEAEADAIVAVRLRTATDDDWPMIRRWLAQPEVIRWWGPKTTSEAEVLLALGSPLALCRIIEARDAAERWSEVGYAHALDAGFVLDPLPADLPAGSWAIDLFVASPAHRGKGVGARALRMMRDEVFGTTLAIAACVMVGVGNEKAVRAYEAAGFEWRSIVRDPVTGPEWVMVAEREKP